MPKYTTRRVSKTTAVIEKTPVSFQPSYDKQFATFYSNFASVSHSTSEFCLDFCLLAPGVSIDMENKSVATPVVVRILIPPDMVDGLMGALKVQQAEYNAQGKDKEALILSQPRAPK